MATARILFVCDAGPSVGGGHVMRCLTLAGALSARGDDPVFLAMPAVASVLDAFAPPGLERVPASPETAALITGAAVAAQGCDRVVIDHYGLAADAHRAIRGSRPALIIDDLADRPLDGQLILDSGPARTAADYAGKVPPDARLLLGTAYAPVRPAFVDLRPEALARRAAGGPVRRLMISLGLTDVDGLTGLLVRRLLPSLGDVALDIVLGSAAPSLAGLKDIAATESRLTLHVDTRAMPDLTLAADAAIGAAGSTTWERCVLALPTLQVIVAENQRAAARSLATAGAVLVVDRSEADFEAQFDAAAARLLGDAALRRELSERSAKVCDGGGADRVAEALLAL